TLVVVVALALLGIELSGVFGGTQRVAAPVPRSSGDVSRDVPGRTMHAAAHLGASSPGRGRPQELFLTRAHSAGFHVKKLKSVVVKKERPEHEDPFAGGEEDADAGFASAMPSRLGQQQMVRTSAQPNTVSPAADSSFAGLDFATWGAGHPPDENGDVG